MWFCVCVCVCVCVVFTVVKFLKVWLLVVPPPVIKSQNKLKPLLGANVQVEYGNTMYFDFPAVDGK